MGPACAPHHRLCGLAAIFSGCSLICFGEIYLVYTQLHLGPPRQRGLGDSALRHDSVSKRPLLPRSHPAALSPRARLVSTSRRKRCCPLRRRWPSPLTVALVRWQGASGTCLTLCSCPALRAKAARPAPTSALPRYLHRLEARCHGLRAASPISSSLLVIVSHDVVCMLIELHSNSCGVVQGPFFIWPSPSWWCQRSRRSSGLA